MPVGVRRSAHEPTRPLVVMERFSLSQKEVRFRSAAWNEKSPELGPGQRECYDCYDSSSRTRVLTSVQSCTTM
jgi:hypothetical protein